MSASAINQHVVLNAFGGPEGLQLVADPIPEPAAGQVLVRVLAASVQYTDVLIRRGHYPDLKDKPPFTPGYDVVGVVERVGPDVAGLEVGDRVADLTMTGSYARYRTLEANRVVRVPDGVDAAQAVSLVLSWMTAYQLLHRHAKVGPGARVLIQGAAGAVGRPLLRLGQLHGLEMFGTCRAEHADLVASFGATPIDYRNEDFRDVLSDGVDVVFDGIGEAGFTKSWSVVRKGGRLAAYGMSDASARGDSFAKVLFWYLRVLAWNVLPNGKRSGFYSITSLRKKQPAWFREDLTRLFGWLIDGAIVPRVQERIGLEEVAEAHRQIERGGLGGKLVIVP